MREMVVINPADFGPSLANSSEETEKKFSKESGKDQRLNKIETRNKRPKCIKIMPGRRQ